MKSVGPIGSASSTSITSSSVPPGAGERDSEGEDSVGDGDGRDDEVRVYLTMLASGITSRHELHRMMSAKVGVSNIDLDTFCKTSTLRLLRCSIFQ